MERVVVVTREWLVQETEIAYRWQRFWSDIWVWIKLFEFQHSKLLNMEENDLYRLKKILSLFSSWRAKSSKQKPKTMLFVSDFYMSLFDLKRLMKSFIQ